jgi:molybdopterin-synthase adenylyltransferase
LVQYLAAAGVGAIGIADDDRVTLSNLQRQVIHDTASLGMAKVDSAARAAARINPHVLIEAHALRITEENARALIARYDVVADGSDNFATRYLLADACEAERRPLVSGSVGRFDGAVTVLAPHLTDADGRQQPRYRDLYPAPRRPAWSRAVPKPACSAR